MEGEALAEPRVAMCFRSRLGGSLALQKARRSYLSVES
jgi:hypothetical protein